MNKCVLILTTLTILLFTSCDQFKKVDKNCTNSNFFVFTDSLSEDSMSSLIELRTVSDIDIFIYSIRIDSNKIEHFFFIVF